MGILGKFARSILGGASVGSRQLQANYTVYIQQKIKKLPSKCTLTVARPSDAKRKGSLSLSGCQAVLVDGDGEFCGALFPRLHALSGYEIGDRVECVVRKPPASGDKATVEFNPSPKKRSLDDRTERFNLSSKFMAAKPSGSWFFADIAEIPTPAGSSARPHICILDQRGNKVAEITARCKAYEMLTGLVGEKRVYTEFSEEQSEYGEGTYYRFRLIMNS